MASPNISGASRVIRLVGGLDALIRGSGSPFTQMTPKRITVAAVDFLITLILTCMWRI